MMNRRYGQQRYQLYSLKTFADDLDGFQRIPTCLKNFVVIYRGVGVQRHIAPKYKIGHYIKSGTITFLRNTGVQGSCDDFIASQRALQ